MRAGNIDKVLVSIIGRALKAITDEMSLSMEKTTRSPILCEAKDFVTGLYDAEGRMLEQTENLPILSFSLSPVCQHIAEKFRVDVRKRVCSHGEGNNICGAVSMKILFVEFCNLEIINDQNRKFCVKIIQGV